MKLLLAIDGSDESHEAIRALTYIQCAEAVHIVHVLDVPTPPYPMMVPEVSQELYATVARNMREDGTRLLKQVVARLPMGIGPVTTHLLTGSPADQIVMLAEQENIDLILLGTRGFGPIKERLFGSVAHRILTYAPGAKLIFPGPLKALERILLPLQGTTDTGQALHFLQQKPFREPPTITLFTVLPHTKPPWPVDAASAEQMEVHALRNAQDFLNDTSAKLDALGYRTRVTTAFGAPVEEILEAARSWNPDLILVGSRGRHGVTRMVLGSVSHALLHQGKYPLMVFG